MTTLTEFVARLQSDVPADNSVPSTAQYQQAVKDAVADFSRRTGRVKIGTLNVISGTATYNLPADFQKMIELLTISVSGTLITPNGLIPMDANFSDEKFTIYNQTITFYPTPTYTMDRDFRYKAGWVLSVDTFLEMGTLEEDIVMLKAQSLALTKQANVPASGLNKYSFGAVSVDKSGESDGTRANAERREREYLDAVDSYNGRAMLIGDSSY